MVNDFTNVVNANNKEIEETKKESENLYLEIEKLKHNLLIAEEEKSIDYLTKTLTRRAYSDEAKKN